jgi:hypothetical protein
MEDLFKHLREVDEKGFVNFLPTKKIIVKSRTDNVLSTWSDNSVQRKDPKGDGRIVIPSSMANLPRALRGYMLRKCGRGSRLGSEGQYPQILSTAKFKTPDGEMSELEWFSMKLGVNLDTRLTNRNWWDGWASTSTDSSNKSQEIVYLDEKPKILDLANIIDNLHYRILYISQDEIAHSYEQRDALQTYRFYLEDEQQQADAKMDAMELQFKAFGELNTLLADTNKKDRLLEILITLDPNSRLSYNAELAHLEKSVKTLCMDTPKQFLELVKENNKDIRLAIFFAAKNGEDITKRGERYETSGGEIIGNIFEVIEKVQKDADFEARILYQFNKAKGLNIKKNKATKE